MGWLLWSGLVFLYVVLLFTVCSMTSGKVIQPLGSWGSSFLSFGW